MSLTSQQISDLLYYKKLPEIYRTMDAGLRYPLKRYLESVVEGSTDIISDTDKLMELIDPMKCPDEYFPHLCESLGISYFPDIDLSYQRKLLMSVGEIIKRRGTYSCVKYLARVLTGLEVELSYIKDVYEGVAGRHLLVTLLADTLEDVNSMEYSAEVIERYVSKHIPYYIIPNVLSQVRTQTIQMTTYRDSFIGIYSHHTLF